MRQRLQAETIESMTSTEKKYCRESKRRDREVDQGERKVG